MATSGLSNAHLPELVDTVNLELLVQAEKALR
jgi:hypothetical protein